MKLTFEYIDDNGSDIMLDDEQIGVLYYWPRRRGSGAYAEIVLDVDDCNLDSIDIFDVTKTEAKKAVKEFFKFKKEYPFVIDYDKDLANHIMANNVDHLLWQNQILMFKDEVWITTAKLLV